jgi:hypothetical protein
MPHRRNEAENGFVASYASTKQAEATRSACNVRRNARFVILALGAALLAVLTAPATMAPCRVPIGQIVILKSSELDPDVFVWDSRKRIVDYAAGDWHGTHDVLAHTVLATSGTRAITVDCHADQIQWRFVESKEDAVGIRVIRGPHRGRYGWVSSEDVHPVERAQASK